MENLGKDVLTLIALEMEYLDIMNFCSSSSKINKALSKNEDFWRNKLYKTYPRMKHWQFTNYKKAYQDTIKINKMVNSRIPETKFFQGNYIKQEMIDFLSYSDIGTFPENEIPLNFLFFPLLDMRVFNPAFFIPFMRKLKNKNDYLDDIEINKHIIFYRKGIVPLSPLSDHEKKFLSSFELKSTFSNIYKSFNEIINVL